MGKTEGEKQSKTPPDAECNASITFGTFGITNARQIEGRKNIEVRTQAQGVGPVGALGGHYPYAGFMQRSRSLL